MSWGIILPRQQMILTFIYSDHFSPRDETRMTFAYGGCHSSLWPEATRFLRPQRAYSWPEAAIVACGLRPQILADPCKLV